MYRIEITDKSGEKEKQVIDDVVAFIGGYSAVDGEGKIGGSRGNAVEVAMALLHAQDAIENVLDGEEMLQELFNVGNIFKQKLEAKKND